MQKQSVYVILTSAKKDVSGKLTQNKALVVAAARAVSHYNLYGILQCTESIKTIMGYDLKSCSMGSPILLPNILGGIKFR